MRYSCEGHGTAIARVAGDGTYPVTSRTLRRGEAFPPVKASCTGIGSAGGGRSLAGDAFRREGGRQITRLTWNVDFEGEEVAGMGLG